MNEISYYRATVNDVETLVTYRIIFALELAGQRPPENEIEVLKRQMTAYFTEATADNSCISFIATHRGKVAGIGSVTLRQVPGNFKNPSGKWGYIMNMYTVPEFRKQGVCTNILNALVKEAAKYGATAFELHATHDGEPVYLANGFSVHNEPTLRKWL